MKLALALGTDNFEAVGGPEFCTWARNQWLELRKYMANKAYREGLQGTARSLMDEDVRLSNRQKEIRQELKTITCILARG